MSIYEYDEEKQRKFDKEEGEERFANLTILLAKANRSDDILRAAQDKDFRENLYKEFQI